MESGFGQVSIVGAGLLGASLGLALKQRGLAARVHGIGRRQCSLDTAFASGAIDSGYTALEEGIAGADLIVLATPVHQATEMLEAVRDAAPPHAVITDVGSTKEALCRHAAQVWSAPRPFVGSHPMAGSEKFGPEHARADLYEGAVCLVEASDELAAEARAVVCRLWEAVGARVVDIDPAQHDCLLARTSHVPHVASAALARLADTEEIVPELIGNGFRDTTRIAAGRPELWREICLSNREAVLAGMMALQDDIAAFAAVLESGDEAAVDAFFEAGRAARQRLCGP
ncbi:MAG: prephenate dehydrogenase/arogenate dehydrogenase family protein [Candidatus Hydrogenedens sp.]|nr:prephenate dehydrogenase/arogenate dehydrogenase family protein [Candidatus Hydrogenedens sp.]